MKPTDIELLALLMVLLHECIEHNNEYHHKTSPQLIAQTVQTIENLKKSIT